MEQPNIKSAHRGDSVLWSERTFLLIRAKEISEIAEASHLKSVMTLWLWDNGQVLVQNF